MSAHTCEDGDRDAEDCRACRAASLAAYEAHGGYHPNLKPLEPGEHTPGVRTYPDYD